MATPTITFKHTNTDTSPAFEEVITRKLEALMKYVGDENPLLEVELRHETRKTEGDAYVMEVNLTCNGELYRASAAKESFEKALDEVRDQLDKELRRTNKKHNNLFLKGARKIKDMMQGDV